MKDKFFRVLQFLRLANKSNNISLTNTALIAVICKFVFMPGVTVTDLCMFLGAVIGYHVKRFAPAKTIAEDVEPLKADIAALQTKVTAMQLGQQIQGRR